MIIFLIMDINFTGVEIQYKISFKRSLLPFVWPGSPSLLELFVKLGPLKAFLPCRLVVCWPIVYSTGACIYDSNAQGPTS
jgi:hypothetical protein